MWFMIRWRNRQRLVWLAPTLTVVGAILLSWAVPALDRAKQWDPDIGDSTFSFDIGAAASLLSSIASGVIGFTGFVFTAVTLALQFGTSNFSARLIPLFQRDRVVRLAMGVFTSTFVYAILIAARLGIQVKENGATQNYKPVLSMFVGIGLALASVFVFFLLVARVIDLLRVIRLLRRVARAGRRAIATVHPRPYDGARETAAAEWGAPTRIVRHNGDPGVLLAFDKRRLLRLAVRWDVRLVIVPAVGDFVTSGNPVIEVHGTIKPIEERGLRRRLLVREERHLEYDPAFALRVIADVALKALSPAINDPTTAVQSLDYLEDLLIRLGNSHLGDGLVHDADGTVRLRYRAPTWEDHVALAVDEIRHYGRDSLQVVRRLRALLDDVAKATPPSRHPALLSRRAALDASTDAFPAALDRTMSLVADAQGIGSGERTR